MPGSGVLINAGDEALFGPGRGTVGLRGCVLGVGLAFKLLHTFGRDDLVRSIVVL